MYMTAAFRYDGLYQVRKIYDSSGKATDNDIPSGGEQYTFFLERLPATNDIAKEEHGYHNLMSIDDLWSQICESHGRPVSKFVSSLSNVDTLPALPGDDCGNQCRKKDNKQSTTVPVEPSNYHRENTSYAVSALVNSNV